MAASREVDGVLLLDKPTGPSSNQALQRVKRLLEAKKAGHAGTLDPLASGLLPILLGEATKFAGYVSDAFKVYDATVLLGVTTTTGDITGEIIERRPVAASASALAEALAVYRGPISQVPPMYSAIKQEGTPLYRLARRGEVAVREPREVYIHELVARDIRADEFDLRIRCSKGTYVRVLAEDIGRALGCGGTLKRLRRMAVGPFDIANAVSLEALDAWDPGARMQALLPPDASVEHLPELLLAETDAKRISLGQSIVSSGRDVTEGTVRMYEGSSGRFLGLGRISDAAVHPLRLVAGRSPQVESK